MFRPKSHRLPTITGTRDDGSAFDPVAQSEAREQHLQLMRHLSDLPYLARMVHPGPRDDAFYFGPNRAGACVEPMLYGARRPPVAVAPMGAEAEDDTIGPDIVAGLVRLGLEAAGWMWAPLIAWALGVRERIRTALSAQPQA